MRQKNAFLIFSLTLVFFSSLAHPPQLFSQSSPKDTLALTPPMGWNSWNWFGCNINENLIKEIAKNVGKILVVEMNIGKYAKEIERLCLPFCPVNSITKNEGISHTKEEIYKVIKEELL